MEISRRAFLAGGTAAGLMADAGLAEAQDRKIEILSAKPSTDRRNISIRFKITDPHPNARYNVRAYLQNPETKGPQPIDILHEGLEAKDYTKFFAARDRNGNVFRDGTYNLILGAVTILKGQPFTIQNHVEIRLGAQQPQKPEISIELEPGGVDYEIKQLLYSFKISDSKKKYKEYIMKRFVIGPKGTVATESIGEPNELWYTGAEIDPLIPGKYQIYIVAKPKDNPNLQISSNNIGFVVEAKKIEKAEVFQVIVKEVNPKQATTSPGVPVGTKVEYIFEMINGQPEFLIEIIGINSKKERSPPFNDKSNSNKYKAWTSFGIEGASEIKILVKDKNGKEAKANIPVYVFKK